MLHGLLQERVLGHRRGDYRHRLQTRERVVSSWVEPECNYIKKGLTPYSIAEEILAMYSANIQYTHLRRQCRVVNKLESQETNGICLFIK